MEDSEQNHLLLFWAPLVTRVSSPKQQQQQQQQRFSAPGDRNETVIQIILNPTRWTSLKRTWLEWQKIRLSVSTKRGLKMHQKTV